MLYVNAKTVLPNFVLNYLADRMEMAYSIEGRVPFLDHHVAEAAARVPVGMKVKGIRGKACAAGGCEGCVFSRGVRPAEASVHDAADPELE
jgi:asparagine synthetase B (glutamine-hydrolysing)